MPIDRNSFADAKKWIGLILSKHENSQEIAEFLSRKIEYANSINSDNWNLNLALNGKSLQFNVGQEYCIRIDNNGILIICLKQSLHENVRDETEDLYFRGYKGKKLVESKKINETPDCLVKIPNSIGIVITRNAKKWLPLTDKSNSEFIDYATINTRIMLNMKNAHSVGAVDFLSSLVGKKLPNPSFTLTQPIGMNFQKISDKQLKIDPVNRNVTSRSYWWFGINNVKTRSPKSKPHIIYPEIEPFLSGEKSEFAWPYGGKPSHLYKHIRVGDSVILWTGDGSYTHDWGILGVGSIAAIQQGDSHTQYMLKMDYVPSLRLTPYPHNNPQKTPETDFLYKTFGSDFRALQKIFFRLKYIERPSSMATTLESVSSDQYTTILAYLRKIDPNISTFDKALDDNVENIFTDTTIKQTVKECIQQTRRGQARFRRDVSERWDGRCAVTGFAHASILRASHIKPWKDSTDKERLDEFNGFFLTPNLDAAFDQGYITFNEDGKIEISENFKDQAEALGITETMCITLYPENEEYLRYHREHVYIGKKRI